MQDFNKEEDENQEEASIVRGSDSTKLIIDIGRIQEIEKSPENIA